MCPSAGSLEVNELTEAYIDSLAEGIIIAACLQYAQQQLANAPYFRYKSKFYSYTWKKDLW